MTDDDAPSRCAACIASDILAGRGGEDTCVAGVFELTVVAITTLMQMPNFDAALQAAQTEARRRAAEEGNAGRVIKLKDLPPQGSA